MSDRHGRPEVQILKGKTTEEKLQSVERVLRRVMRKTNKYATVVIPPVPISGYVHRGEMGVIAKQLFPVSGKIVSVYLDLDKIVAPEGKKIGYTEVGINLKGSMYSKGVMLQMKVGRFNKEVDIDVSAGDQFIMSTTEIIEGLSYAMLFVPNREVCKVEEVLLEKIDSSMVDMSNEVI